MPNEKLYGEVRHTGIMSFLPPSAVLIFVYHS